MKELPFSIVPVEAAMDDRLSKGELRVLIALLSFRNRTTDLCYPKREAIVKRTGYSVNMVSRMTTKLCGHGWLEKSGDGGMGKSCKYVIAVPDVHNVAATATGAAVAPLPRAAVAPLPRAAVAPLNKQTIKQTRLTDNVQTGFALWWEQYPKKVNKKKSLIIWKRIKPDAELLIADVINRKANDSQWTDGYIPHPTTYLNGERWNDEIEHGRIEEDLQPWQLYGQDRDRADKYFSEVNGDAVGDNGKVIQPAVVKEQRSGRGESVCRLGGRA